MTRHWGLTKANRIGRMAALSAAKATPRKRRQQEGFGLAASVTIILLAGGATGLALVVVSLWVGS